MKAKQGQSFLDLVTQSTGSVENAFAMSLLDSRSVTDKVAIGEEIKPGEITNKTIASLFGGDVLPATAPSKPFTDIAQPSVGIGSMIIEENFIVG